MRWPRIERAMALVLAAGLAIRSAPAAADEASEASEAPGARPWAGSVGVSGYVALGGPADSGLAAVAALYPGAWAGRLGLRLEARTIGQGDRFDRALYTAGLACEAAASRPRLALALHGEAGAVAPDPRAAVGGGVELELWLVGPVALAVDGGAHVLVDGLDSELVLAAGLGLRIAR
ncbi:MAG TPA: hypothetical protein VKB80_02050 [Kofleriaceae bacterium]|nr:hypothetical protein [Kofleriaceae bacterium]